MGTIALIQSEKGGPVRYLECHVNFWSLSGFLDRVNMLDVGLTFTPAGPDDVSQLVLMIPARDDEVRFSDLADVLTDSETASLVVGAKVDTPQGALLIHEPTGDKRWMLIDVGEATPDDTSKKKAWRRERLSIWHLDLARAVPSGSTAYVRVRFQIFNPTRTWTWGVAKRSALIDMRFADIRETVSRKSEARAQLKGLSQRFLPVEKLNMLVIAPAWLQLRASTPELRYMRLFEGRVWETYLMRTVDFIRRNENLMVYHWRWGRPETESSSVAPTAGASIHGPGHPAKVAGEVAQVRSLEVEPRRAFLLLSKESRLAPISNHVLTAGLSAVAIIAVLNGHQMADAAAAIWAAYWTVLAAIGPTVLVIWLVEHVSKIRDVTAMFRRAWTDMEATLYSWRRF